MMEVRAFSQACENNKNPIFNILSAQLKQVSNVLEIGSGTAQHAIFFTTLLPNLTWQTTDQGEYFSKLQELIEQQQSSQLPEPLQLDVNQAIWPVQNCEFIFTANTLHIMPWSCVEKLFLGIKSTLAEEGHFYLYGPFNYNGQYTSKSNQEFDLRLKETNQLSGIRDIEKILQLAKNAQLELLVDHEMPANNRLLHFRKK